MLLEIEADKVGEPTPSSSGGMERYMHNEGKARSKGKKKAERGNPAQQDVCTNIRLSLNLSMFT